MTDREKVILEMIQELFLMLKVGYNYPESFESKNPILNAYKKSFDLTLLLKTELSEHKKKVKAELNHNTIVEMSKKTVDDMLKQDKKNKEDTCDAEIKTSRDWPPFKDME